MSHGSSRLVRSALNRLVVACRDEELALEAAAPLLPKERRTQLQRQSRRRVVFRRDLGTGLVALHGVPSIRGSYGAAWSLALWRAGRLFGEPPVRDAYVACADAANRTARAYAEALSLVLPADVRFGVERQFAEIVFDREELARLRRGESPSPLPLPPEPVRTAKSDAAALEVWGDEGGHAGPTRSATPVA